MVDLNAGWHVRYYSKLLYCIILTQNDILITGVLCPWFRDIANSSQQLWFLRNAQACVKTFFKVRNDGSLNYKTGRHETIILMFMDFSNNY